VAVSKIETLRKLDDGRLAVTLRGNHGNPPGEAADSLVISRRHLAEVRRRIRGD
jgi:hypothetical protein